MERGTGLFEEKDVGTSHAYEWGARASAPFADQSGRIVGMYAHTHALTHAHSLSGHVVAVVVVEHKYNDHFGRNVCCVCAVARTYEHTPRERPGNPFYLRELCVCACVRECVTPFGGGRTRFVCQN